jgi:alpha-beta hydrolase superfamily lysophospholipase
MSDRRWQIIGAQGEAILGNVHPPSSPAPSAGTLVICHGSMGYKDYGLLPRLAEAACDAGWTAHRFNFSHSGMTHDFERFERPDLYRRDTWRKQAIDLRAVLHALADGTLTHGGGPVAVFGHSRGGVTALLTTRWMLEEGDPAAPDRVITAAAPARINRLSEEEIAVARRDGTLERRSHRTGQTLWMDRVWIDEQEADPAWHDPLTAGARLVEAGVPWLILHGDADETVPIDEGERYRSAAGGEPAWRALPGGNHVFDCPNPPPPAEALPATTRATIDAVLGFLAG